MKQYATVFLSGLLGIMIHCISLHSLQAQDYERSQQATKASSCTKLYELDLIIRDRFSSNRDTLTIAQSATATDGIDSACNESETPPPPPSPIFGVTFQLPSGSLYSKTDVRGSGETVTWTLQFSGTYPFSLFWNPDDLPAGVFRLTDNVDGSLVNLDMATASRLTIRSRSITSLKIQRYPASSCVNLTVARGWNLISIPKDLTDKRTTAVFRSRKARAYSYSNGYAQSRLLTPGKGYWVSFRRAGTYQMCGQPAGGSVTLSSGWNLVGTHNAAVATADLTTSPTDLINSSFFGYTTTYAATDTLHVGKAYWVESDAAGTMAVADASKRSAIQHGPMAADQPSDTAPDVALPALYDEAWSVLNFHAEDVFSQNLYLSHRPITSEERLDYEMPPRVPGAAIDARFTSNLEIANIYGGPATLRLEGNNVPLTVSVSNLPHTSLRVESIEANKPLSLVIDEKLPAVIPPGYGVFQVEQVPRVVSIESPTVGSSSIEVQGNYPNPFRSQTTLQWVVHEPQHIRITAYNAIGQSIETLYDGFAAIGSHNLIIDGSDWPAGLYFYRIESDQFSSTHTLSLVR